MQRRSVVKYDLYGYVTLSYWYTTRIVIALGADDEEEGIRTVAGWDAGTDASAAQASGAAAHASEHAALGIGWRQQLRVT